MTIAALVIIRLPYFNTMDFAHQNSAIWTWIKKAAIGFVMLGSLWLVGTSCRNSSQAAQQVALDSLISNKSFVTIHPGEFLMGSSFTEDTSLKTELRMRPLHQVKISQAFEMSKYEITQAQWEAVMGYNPSQFKGAQLPVENVSWQDVQTFLERLQPLDDQHQYRLPTEAEWEYACRAGSNGEFSGEMSKEATATIPSQTLTKVELEERKKTPKSKLEIERENAIKAEREAYRKSPAYAENLMNMAWFYVNAGGRTHPVGEKAPNAWGLYDLHGNVFEWCQDWYEQDYYQKSPVENPSGPAQGESKVYRGGSWQAPAYVCSVPMRGYDPPTMRTSVIGFRVVRVKQK